MSLLMVLMIAVSLSMDAFSLSLAYGTLSMEKKERRFLAVVVGIYHFFMPLLGMVLGAIILKFLPLSPNIIVFIVLSFIGIEMIIDSFKQDRSIPVIKLSEFLLFGLAVSLDSFSVGLGLKVIYSNPFISCALFSISSAFFTALGLFLGKIIHEHIGKISTFFGGIALIMLGISYLL